MAKIEKEVPTPSAGGTYVFDPKTGKSTLIPESDTPTKENGSNKKDLVDSQD